MKHDVNLNDPRLIDPATLGHNDGGKGRLRPGAALLALGGVANNLRAGGQFALAPDSEWREVGANCDCGAKATMNCAGLQWPVCDRCMNGALECLAILDNDDSKEAA